MDANLSKRGLQIEMSVVAVASFRRWSPKCPLAHDRFVAQRLPSLSRRVLQHGASERSRRDSRGEGAEATFGGLLLAVRTSVCPTASCRMIS